MNHSLDRDLHAALRQIARVPHLLIACDYDGTLAPIVDDPSTAVPLPETATAVRELAVLPQTTVAVVSSRSLRDLATLSRLPGEVHLVGSHGSEFDIGFVQRLPPELVDLRDRLLAELRTITKDRLGVRLEEKPASVAVHTRTAEPTVAEEIVTAIASGPAQWPGVHVSRGKKVIDLSVMEMQKGAAVDSLRAQLSASAVLFLGDDVTDESVFHQLRGPDVGVKIGTGDTRAEYRVPEPLDAAAVLDLVLSTRRAWLFGEERVPIERHTMLSNGRTVALLAPDSRVTWFCHPRPDSPALFADLLGGPSAGHFSITPENGSRPFIQRYRPGTMTVETKWPGLTVTDWLDSHSAGTSLMRMAEGTGSVIVDFAPRPEFGQVPIQLQAVGDGLLILGSNEPTVLYSPGVEWTVQRNGGFDSARALFDLRAMGPLVLELRCGSDDVSPPLLRVADRLEAAERPWREWAATLRLPSVAADAVLRSALTLRGLWYEPSGAILAAATTSLPEVLGGARNWDYRYCWLRDAAMSARALVDVGSLEEAEALLAWVDECVTRTGGHPERLHPLYTIDGTDLGAEAVIETLPGYAGSRPVRVGNAANRQVQLDVFGPVADLLAAVANARGSVRDQEWRVLEAMVKAVERSWHAPDHGLWEARLAPRHHVYSKVMCWLTVDCAIAVASDHGGRTENLPRWEALREEIRRDILDRGWNPEVGAFTEAYDHPDLDAASLWVGLAGLLPDDDPRFLSTVLAIEAELRSGPTVYRYRWPDGLPGNEGGFHLCTTWMIEAYLRTGRRTEAEDLFAQLLDCVGPTGLLPEMYDPIAEKGLGNHPQAYSHLGLIRCARLLAELPSIDLPLQPAATEPAPIMA